MRGIHPGNAPNTFGWGGKGERFGRGNRKEFIAWLNRHGTNMDRWAGNHPTTYRKHFASKAEQGGRWPAAAGGPMPEGLDKDGPMRPALEQMYGPQNLQGAMNAQQQMGGGGKMGAMRALIMQMMQGGKLPDRVQYPNDPTALPQHFQLAQLFAQPDRRQYPLRKRAQNRFRY